MQFFDNRGDTVVVAEGGWPALQHCQIEGALGAGLRFQALGSGTIEDVDVLGSTGPGVEIEAGGTPSLKRVKVVLGKGPGIVAKAEAAGTLEACEVLENAGGDWLVDPAAQVVKT